ncbi:dihydroneopterin aldolase [Mesorhizobium sp. J18]|uniref:(5-formylfuran-3-yl)methyl phosphate synthase n=1 Tax=Mesorhizobium sp. J18 TaxID=935263 RepID=UPI00119B1A77|nr:(5-formylfuran-3-yl)methyl phosphate synthase [Mesorhizobium sp. J18]TWG94965.1 dihydroneopterin aldolase [Mesorhizobium sp. J18]
MTQFLASVKGVDEARIALAGGADIIDLKNPRDGALGAVAVETVRQTVADIAGRRPISAVCGNLPMEPERFRAAAEAMAATGVDYLKVGIPSYDKARACVEALAPLATQVKIVAVLFADLYPDFDILPVLAQNGFHGVMLDTAGKGRGRLLDHIPPEHIPAFLDRARSLDLMVGLSGSLEAPDIPRLLPLQPDFLGFRGALCADSRRDASINPEAVKRIRELIPEELVAQASATVDYRLLAARGYSPEVEDPGLGTDKIFVRDFVLPVEIGAYSFEHGRKQNVRFDVTAEVRRLTSNPQDMRHVVSYDIIIDGIRAIVSRGHVELSETLAEQVASHVLEDPRVVRVSVRVEKLELGAGSVGVEIERMRAKEQPVSKKSGAAGNSSEEEIAERRRKGLLT